VSSPYIFKKIESKWQQFWDAKQIFKTADIVSHNKYYVLEMFPYPSGHIHMGHVRNYTLGDICARFKRAQGYDVLHPMGWDAFGLPAENAARAHNVHPKTWTQENIAAMRDELKHLGLSLDWSRELATCDPSYYRYEQQFIIDFFKAGLLYRKESFVNWDPIENTVLANEQVVNGRGWRSDALVEQRKMNQWYLRITDFAKDLLDGLDTLKDTWPEKVITMQRNWIGRSQGAKIKFNIYGVDDQIEVFTTRPETIYGCSFLALSIHHPIVNQLCQHDEKIQQFIQTCSVASSAQADLDKAEKIGICTNYMAIHPLDPSRKIPIYLANFVLMDYGTGAVMGVPAHDSRDFDFAQKYSLPILSVIDNETDQPDDKIEGKLINSPLINGLTIAQAQEKIIAYLVANNIGQQTVSYRLKDWGISRQRFWGCPIPFIHCPTCGVVPEKPENLPIQLPDDVSFDQPGNPLDSHPTWKHTSCPMCDQPALRETDTLDTFFESSWYFMRFISQPDHQAFDSALVDAWLSVDKYIGGIEHAVMHLLYARFFTRALNKCGYTTHLEPFKSLVTQGMLCHQTYQDQTGQWLYPEQVIFRENQAFEDKTGLPVIVGRSIKMSKSKHNVVTPQSIRDSYGVDAARLFVVSDTPPERDFDWSEAGVQGIWKFLNRLWRLCDTVLPHINLNCQGGRYNDVELKLKRQIHQTINLVTNDLEQFGYNQAIARLRTLFNVLEGLSSLESYQPSLIRECIQTIIQLFNPMIPHICEELWEKLGHTISLAQTSWPIADANYLVNDDITVAIQVNGKLRATLQVNRDIDQDTLHHLALNLENVKRALDAITIRRVVYIPQKVLNIVGH